MPVSYLDRRSAELHAYVPELTRRPDFHAFWDEMLECARAVPLAPELDPVDYPNRRLRVLDVSYDGFDGTRIHGWLIRPVAGAMVGDLPERLPCLVHYHGFGGSRGRPADFAAWTQLGIAVLSVNVRDQRGSTGNAARSQGGGIASAVSALDPRPCAALVDVPSNSNQERRSEIKVAAYSGTGAFAAVNDYLREHPDHIDRVFETLSYFATYNRITAEKEMTIYPFCGHGDGASEQRERQIRYLAERVVGE